MQDDTSFTLGNLSPETTYEALVCRPNLLDVYTLDPFGLPQCGFCVVCFKTGPRRIRFEETSVSQLNDTHVSLTCRVNTNVYGTYIGWSIAGEPRRRDLFDGDRFNGQRVSIAENTDIPSGTTTGKDFVMTRLSVLVAPSSILERDVRCSAATLFGTQRSMPGAFQGACSYII